MSDELKLLPCPFCGGTNIQEIDLSLDDPWFCIDCKSCSGLMGSETSFEDARFHWNYRHESAEIVNARVTIKHQSSELATLKAECERLRKALESCTEALETVSNHHHIYVCSCPCPVLIDTALTQAKEARK